MKVNFPKSEHDYMNKYEQMGYSTHYKFYKNQLININSKKHYDPTDIFIVAQHRFEGMSNPCDLSILYIIESSDGSKGNILLNYNLKENLELVTFFNAIPKENISNKVNIL